MHARETSQSQRGAKRAVAVCIRVALLAAWMVGIFAFSAQVGSESDGVSDALASFVQSLGMPIPMEALTVLVRKGAHAFAYFGLGVLAVFALRLSKLSVRTRSIASVAFVLAYAISDEVHQLLVPGRSGDVRDILLDTVAGTLGVLVLLLVYRARDKQAVLPRPRP